MEGSLKLIGFKYSPTVEEVLLASQFAKAPVVLENIPWGDPRREELKQNATPTGTFPILVTSQGNLAESRAINQYLAETYNPQLLGATSFEKAQVRQWTEFAALEIARLSKAVIYPTFGWAEYDKTEYEKAQHDIKEYLKHLNKHLEGKTFLVGSNVTLADITMFSVLRFWFQLIFVENMRKSLFPQLTTWFVAMAHSEQAMTVYGRTLLCKVPSKPFITEKKEEKKEEKKAEKKEEKKAEKKEEKEDEDEEEAKPKTIKKVNPLDLLPPTTFEMDTFKRDFLNAPDKKEALVRFWNSWDPNGFSFWWIEYQKLPNEGKILFRTNNCKSFFLQKLDNFRKYTFSVHGVYGVEGNYEIRGLWFWRGTDIPEEFKSHDSFPFLTMKKLDPSNPEDKNLIEEYWLKINEGEEVQGMKVAEVEYFK